MTVFRIVGWTVISAWFVGVLIDNANDRGSFIMGLLQTLILVAVGVLLYKALDWVIDTQVGKHYVQMERYHSSPVIFGPFRNEEVAEAELRTGLIIDHFRSDEREKIRMEPSLYVTKYKSRKEFPHEHVYISYKYSYGRKAR